MGVLPIEKDLCQKLKSESDLIQSRDSMPKIQAPVLGLYGGNDARVNATIGWADTTMKALNKSYTYSIFEGAGHGFLRGQDQTMYLEAAKKAWPQTIAFFRQHLK